jgi:hypothetical protein
MIRDGYTGTAMSSNVDRKKFLNIVYNTNPGQDSFLTDFIGGVDEDQLEELYEILVDEHSKILKKEWDSSERQALSLRDVEDAMKVISNAYRENY